MIINHNMNAMNAHRQMGVNNTNNGKAIEKLSSGLRINRAGDDAAGLSISEKMRGQIRGLDQSSRNSQDGISLLQTAEGGTNETHNILQRMRELATQSANGTNITEDRKQIQKEFTQLQGEINRISSQTQFNKQDLLKSAQTVTFQVGANAGQTIAIALKTMNAAALAVDSSKATVTTQSGASKAITSIDKAIETVSAFRADLGSVQNRLESAVRSTSNASENLQAAESRIRDVDMAKEMMNFSKTNILSQAAQAMLSQANQQPQGVLQLLR
ncbi:flagellin [Clostridium gasigenes]|uniref:flagellin N-terminal helical domain-containing protein n=1 Tax=Clostridium gasigenes TaxID=94869 RepID=UPI001C0CCBBE|nr:flagellin [Clostridium gasigenes]MBU3088631.1 flagellin [Clostridium gasigenes]